MTDDATNFLTTLLWLADSPDDHHRPFKDATIHQFSPEFVESVENFLHGFRDFLQNNGFNCRRLRNLERSFGGSTYLSLSGHGAGFFDERDSELGGDLQHMLDLYACGHHRFHELESMLEWCRGKRGQPRCIDLSFLAKHRKKYRDSYFVITLADRLRQLKQAGDSLTEAMAYRTWMFAPAVKPPTTKEIKNYENTIEILAKDWKRVSNLKYNECTNQ